jgi:glycosyltransferase involved in cell wall biosynthesis
MRVAIVHDWLNGMRGGERVLETLLELYPEATIYTLFHEPGKTSGAIESKRIVTSWLDHLPGIHHYYRNLLPLFPSAIASMNLSGYDLVISSSHSVAKAVRTGHALHICYCHTPARYIWDSEDDYQCGLVRRLALASVRRRLQVWDCEAASQVDHFIANSRFVAERIRLYYGREAEVIYPPVDTRFFTPGRPGSRGDFYLAVGAMVPYKRFDLVVRAFNRLNRRLIVAGNGPELKRLRAMAAANVDVRGWVSAAELRQLYRSAQALVFAGREDFGIVSAEARACGCPVIAFAAGGSSEIVYDKVQGILFAEQSSEDIVRSVQRFETMTWPEHRVRNGVEKFSSEAFKTRIRKSIESRTAWQRKRHPATPQLA